jgi:transcriptional regulator with XRE-family HTH domain
MLRLLRYRLSRGLTQAQAAALVGVSIPTWRRWEEGPDGWMPPNRSALLTPHRFQAWYCEGDWERGCALATTATARGYLLPEVGRSILVQSGEEEEWCEVLDIVRDGHSVKYITQLLRVAPEQVHEVRP